MSTAPLSVRLCEPSTKLEQDWRTIYETAFPAGEREPESRLQQLINDGKLLYHKTIGKQGELLCFSMVSLLPNFSFLAYIATDPNQRSGGYGSKHMKALLDLLRKDYPTHVGLFLEIESTNPKKSQPSPEEKLVRQRRFGFYKRLGTKRFCRSMNYRAPSPSGDGSEHEFDLLFFGFADKPLTHAEKAGVVTDIFERLYGLDKSHTLVQQVTASALSCTHPHCEDDDDSSPGTGSGGTTNTQGDEKRDDKTATDSKVEKSTDDNPAPEKLAS